MSRFLALTRREIAGILLTPATYFATAFLVLIDSFAFYLTAARPGVSRAVFDDMALFMLFTSTLLYPFIAMRSYAEENADGVIETLLTAPVGRLTTVLAKFASTMCFVVLAMLPAVVYAALMSYGGDLDWNATAAALLSLFLSGAVAMSLGIFISALTVSPVAAGAATCLILVFMIMAADFDPYAGPLASFINATSLVPHAKRWIAGELDTRGLVYFVSVICLFLFYARLSVGIRDAGGKSSDRTARRRMNVTYALVCCGIVLMVLQVAILHIKGFWESGTPILGSSLRRVPWPWLIPGLAALALFIWSLLTFKAARRAERHNRPSHGTKYISISDSQVMSAPRLYYDSNRSARARSLVAAAAALAIVINLNWLAQYPFNTFANSAALYPLSFLRARSWDVTTDKKNSLSESTKRTLDSLQGKAEVYSFLHEEGSHRGVPLAEEMRRLLVRYNDYNGLVVPTFVDSKNDRERAALLAEELETPMDQLDNTLVIEYNNRRLTIPASSLAAPPDWKRESAGDGRWVFDGEKGVTQTLMRLLDPRIPTAFFAYGNRELFLHQGLRPEYSALRLVAAMEKNNLRVRRFLFTGSQPISPDCDILVLAAPRLNMNKLQVEAVRKYLEQGGRLLLIGPPPDHDNPLPEDSPLNQLAYAIGGGFRDDLVEDRIHNADGLPSQLLGRVKGMGESDLRFVFPSTRSIRDNPLAPEGGWVVERLLEAYPSSLSRPLAGGESLHGPLTLAYRSVRTTDKAEARAVVFASSRMASDADIGKGENESILMAMSQWLAGREETYQIQPRTWVDRSIVLGGPGQRLFLWLGVVALPFAWLLAGVSVWWVRKE